MVFQQVECEKCECNYHAETTLGNNPLILTECPFCKISVPIAGCQLPT